MGKFEKKDCPAVAHRLVVSSSTLFCQTIRMACCINCISLNNFTTRECGCSNTFGRVCLSVFLSHPDSNLLESLDL